MLVMLIARKHLGLLPASSSLPDKLGTKVVPLAIDLSGELTPSLRREFEIGCSRSFELRLGRLERERENSFVIFSLVTLDMRTKIQEFR